MIGGLTVRYDMIISGQGGRGGGVGSEAWVLCVQHSSFHINILCVQHRKGHFRHVDGECSAVALCVTARQARQVRDCFIIWEM
jgi:hypothetical protein